MFKRHTTQQLNLITEILEVHRDLLDSMYDSVNDLALRVMSLNDLEKRIRDLESQAETDVLPSEEKMSYILAACKVVYPRGDHKSHYCERLGWKDMMQWLIVQDGPVFFPYRRDEVWTADEKAFLFLEEALAYLVLRKEKELEERKEHGTV